jgi:hypothetical protein
VFPHQKSTISNKGWPAWEVTAKGNCARFEIEQKAGGGTSHRDRWLQSRAKQTLAPTRCERVLRM